MELVYFAVVEIHVVPYQSYSFPQRGSLDVMMMALQYMVESRDRLGINRRSSLTRLRITCGTSSALYHSTHTTTMPPRLNLFTARSVAFRTRPFIPQTTFTPGLVHHRAASDNASSKQPATTPADPNIKGPSMDPLPHVSEEQAALDKSMGNTPPDIEQGTPVQEVSEIADTRNRKINSRARLTSVSLS